MYSKRIFSAISLMVVLTMLLSACGAPQLPAPAAADGKDLTDCGCGVPG